MKPRWIRPSSWTEGAYRAMLREALQAEPHGELAEGMASARGARAALVASGTATLELALLKVPMVVAYRVDALSFALAKRLVKVKYVSLVNLVLGREAVNERLQSQCMPELLADDLRALMVDGPRRTMMLEDFDAFAKALGEGGAMDRTAAYLLQE